DPVFAHAGRRSTVAERSFIPGGARSPWTPPVVDPTSRSRARGWSSNFPLDTVPDPAAYISHRESRFLTMRKSARAPSLYSVDRAIDILFYLGDHPLLSVHDLSERLRWPKSTTYRFLRVLRRKQLVERDPATARYRVGLGILRVQRAVLAHLPVRMAALPVMRDLAPRLGETVVLTVRRGDFGVAVESIESLEPVRVAPGPGDHVPLHCGAPMKVILAFSPEDDISRYLRRKLERYTPNTICQPRKLRLHLAEIRARGYAESWEEVFAGATGIAAPIVGVDGHADASLAVAGPIQRMNPERVRAIGQDLIAAVQEVTKFKRAGGGAVVDLTNVGLGRDPVALTEIARETGLHLVMGSGYYVAPSHPPDMDTRSVEQITDEITTDIVEGVGQTRVRA